MSLFGGIVGGGGSKEKNPQIAACGKWLGICVGLYCAVFYTVDLWDAVEPRMLDMIYDRYQGGLARLIYWLLRLAAYPLVFFAVRFGLSLSFVGILTWLIFNVSGSRR